jgi:hypothetical protein
LQIRQEQLADVMAGSLWIMANRDANMIPSAELMNLSMQH